MAHVSKQTPKGLRHNNSFSIIISAIVIFLAEQAVITVLGNSLVCGRKDVKFALKVDGLIKKALDQMPVSHVVSENGQIKQA